MSTVFCITDPSIKYYLDCIYDNDVSALIDKVENGTLTQKNIDEISEMWKESMACGALCYYKWFKEDPMVSPNLKSTEDDRIKLEDRAWSLFSEFKEEEFLQLEEGEHEDEDRKYTRENFEYSVIKWCNYYIIEAYFSH